MSSQQFENLRVHDPFAEAEGAEGFDTGMHRDCEELGFFFFFLPFSLFFFVVAGKGSFVHIRIQQRSGRKTLTTVQGLAPDLNLKKILKYFKREFCCNGTIVKDPEMGKVIQVQGDQRQNISNFLTTENICEKSQIKIHGF